MKKKLYFSIFICTFFPSLIFGDGGYYKTPEIKLYMPSQKVIVSNIDGEEKIIIQSELQGSCDEFVWIIPVPFSPQIKILKNNIFDEVERKMLNPDLTNIQLEKINNRDQNSDKNTQTSSEGFSNVEDSEEAEGKMRVATVLDSKIFQSKEEGELNSFYLWLNRRNIDLGETANKIIDDYLKKDYYFIAIKLHAINDSDSDKLEKWKTPAIFISFKSKEPFFPLRLHSQNLQETKLDLYMIDTTLAEDNSIFSSTPVNSRPQEIKFTSGMFSDTYGYFFNQENRVYFINKFSDVIQPGKNFDDLILDPVLIKRNKYKFALENTDLSEMQRVRIIQILGDDKDPQIQDKLRALLKDKNNTIVLHAGIALWKNTHDPEMSKIIIEQFKKTCDPFYYDCYPSQSEKSFIELIKELEIKEGIPILVEIINKAREEVIEKRTNKGLPPHIIRTLEAMYKLGTTKEAVPGLLYVLDHDQYFYYNSIILAIKMLGEVGSDELLPKLTNIAKQDWGGSSPIEAWPYYGLRDASYEAILKIQIKKMKALEEKILFLRKLMNESSEIEESYQATIMLLRLGDKGLAENKFSSFIKMDNHLYNAAEIANEIGLSNVVLDLIDTSERRKGNVPSTVYLALEKLDTNKISFATLIKIIETNPNTQPVENAKKILMKNGNADTIKLIQESKLMESEVKKEIIANIEKKEITISIRR
ncbi:DUF2330 domain-containing protein [Candidatus Poribacteria bacterium]|nr:DUF2330 domain-containing protein [Candidatus Poribacteria bacterium]